MHLSQYYDWLKAFHLIALIAWMAGMLYLPRLYAYHCRVAPGSEAAEIFKVMERRLLRIIMNPAMIATIVFGALLWYVRAQSGVGIEKWLHVKFGLVLFMAALHAMLARFRKEFERGQNTRSEKFYRIINEIPAVLLVAIVLLAVLKPF